MAIFGEKFNNSSAGDYANVRRLHMALAKVDSR
jgi:hypothetical protein